jgi:hypothetical protein
MQKRRWPKSLRCQTIAVLQTVRGIGRTKAEAPLDIRSLRTWDEYKEEHMRFVDFLSARGCTDILNAAAVGVGMRLYLGTVVERMTRNQGSLQTVEKMLAALSKFELAVNRYLLLHLPGYPLLETASIRRECLSLAGLSLPRFSSPYVNRAYPDPEALIGGIANDTYRLQAVLQLEGGMRTEGVGAPRGRLRNPLTAKALRGLVPEPLTGEPSGAVATREKGGKVTTHYVSTATYALLVRHLERFGELASDYQGYLAALNLAAVATGQHATGRGSHGLKFDFAQRRYWRLVECGFSHEEAMQQVSLEISHRRMKETLTYTGDRR